MSQHPVENPHNDVQEESAELAAYKELCIRVAWRYALQYGWCNEVLELLEHLQIALTEPEIRATVWVRYDVRGRIPWDLATTDGDKEALVRQWLHVPSLLTRSVLHSDDLPDEDIGNEEMLFDPAVVTVADVRLTKPARRTA